MDNPDIQGLSSSRSINLVGMIESGIRRIMDTTDPQEAAIILAHMYTWSTALHRRDGEFNEAWAAIDGGKLIHRITNNLETVDWNLLFPANTAFSLLVDRATLGFQMTGLTEMAIKAEQARAYLAFKTMHIGDEVAWEDIYG